MTVVRRCLAAVALTALAALVGFAPVGWMGRAYAQDGGAALVAKPVSLPDMVLGSAKAPVTITEYSSMSCPHCAAFGENVFPMLRSKYIETGKVRFVFREFPLDIKAAAASMLARCIAKDNSEKFFGAVEILFKQQERLMAQTKDTLKSIGKLSGMSEQEVETCQKDQTLLDKLAADQKFAFEVLKVDERRPSSSMARGSGARCRSRNWKCGSRRISRTDGEPRIDTAQGYSLAFGSRAHGSTKLKPIRFFWIQAIRHSRTEESRLSTRRKRDGTNAGFSTSMAAPSGEIFRTTQLITEPSADT